MRIFSKRSRVAKVISMMVTVAFLGSNTIYAGGFVRIDKPPVSGNNMLAVKSLFTLGKGVDDRVVLAGPRFSPFGRVVGGEGGPGMSLEELSKDKVVLSWENQGRLLGVLEDLHRDLPGLVSRVVIVDSEIIRPLGGEDNAIRPQQNMVIEFYQGQGILTICRSALNQGRGGVLAVLKNMLVDALSDYLRDVPLGGQSRYCGKIGTYEKLLEMGRESIAENHPHAQTTDLVELLLEFVFRIYPESDRSSQDGADPGSFTPFGRMVFPLGLKHDLLLGASSEETRLIKCSLGSEEMKTLLTSRKKQRVGAHDLTVLCQVLKRLQNTLHIPVESLVDTVALRMVRPEGGKITVPYAELRKRENKTILTLDCDALELPEDELELLLHHEIFAEAIADKMEIELEAQRELFANCQTLKYGLRMIREGRLDIEAKIKEFQDGTRKMPVQPEMFVALWVLSKKPGGISDGEIAGVAVQALRTIPYYRELFESLPFAAEWNLLELAHLFEIAQLFLEALPGGIKFAEKIETLNCQGEDVLQGLVSPELVFGAAA